MTTSAPRVYFVTGVLFLGALALMLEFSPRIAAANGDSPVATWLGGAVRLTIPYRGLEAGAGEFKVELLDPEDHAVGRAEARVEVVAAGRGSWQEEIRPDKPIALEDLVWHRVRYRFRYAGRQDDAVDGTESISQILRMPVIRILGQQSYLAGGPAAVRVIVTDSKNETIAGPASVRIELTGDKIKPQTLLTGRLNRSGTAEAQFRFPAALVGAYRLRYIADTVIGSTEITQPVRLESKASILLTTEKPIYQPGQTIHVRALALDRSNHEASAGRALTFEVEDSRGNKVFKKTAQTDRFGVASAEFALADEVNLGTYHLRALMDTNTAEVALNVERYVLPKFKVAVDFGGANQPARHGYRPGDHITGTVRANYFFGKPVDGAEITVKASAMDVAVFEAASAQAKSDRDGEYRFDVKLPSYFAGRPLSQGAARVLIEATVKDTAGHAETRGEPITVSESPLLITAVPEGGTLIPNLENQVFVLTSYADGKPAIADIKVRAAGNPEQSATTDAGGVAVVRITAGAGNAALEIEAKDKAGNRAVTPVKLDARSGEDQILLRTERAVYRAGDRIQLRVFSTKSQGTAYVDAVKDGQTILTRDLDLKNGQAELILTATPDLAGTLDFNAYLFGRDARPVGDHRLVFVQPADELKIEASTDAPSYRPGDDARIRFRVTNSRGEGVQAALGVQVVDEAVFALAEKQPGFAKVFFYLEQETMKPRYEIHSIGMPEAVETARNEQRDRAARALFAATEMVSGNRFETEAGRNVPAAKYGEYWGRYRVQMIERIRQAYARNGKPEIRDAWGTGLRIENAGWNGRTTYMVRSAGPDKQFNTGDDLGVYVELRKGTAVRRPDSGKIDLAVEHERGPFNGLAAVTGSVLDATGAAIPEATVTLREIAGGRMRSTRSGNDGRFVLTGVAPGAYNVEISAGGFRIASRDLTLQARDRAMLTTRLEVGATTETVAVMEMPQRLRAGGNMIFAEAAGIAGGVPGGVVGGIMDAEVRQFAMPAAPAKAMMALDSATALKKDAGASAPRVRSYFPEALYINPEIITDQNGAAAISIPLADSITTWRMALFASTTRGALGSGASSIKIFQDFFVDLDLPVTLTQGDRVSIPVGAYNYSGERGEVGLQLQPADWYSLVEDSAAKSIGVDAGRVGGTQFSIEANRIGKFKLTLAARMSGGARRADTVVREIEVVPNGREQTMAFNGRLETTVEHEIAFPATAIPDAGKIYVRLYPGPLSQIVEGMDAILRMPFGCFEQTSSATYPNVLALDYMKRLKKLTPEIHAKAEGFIGTGYQRLLTYEVPGGGFSWFGNPPANKILTSYGLMEFFDMSKVHDVDANLIARTQRWLVSQQQPDGSWKPDTQFINEGATNRYNASVLRITAYVAWSLENTGYQGPGVEKARQYVAAHLGERMDAYTQAVLANFAVDYGKDRAFTRQAMQLLLDARTEKGDQAWWTADETGVYATGASASVETTGLAVQALLKWGEASGTAEKALRYIASKKDASGAWGTTQATIMSLRALLLSTEKGAADVRGTIEVSLNGKPVERLTLTPENNDLLHQFVLKDVDGRGVNRVAIRFDGKGGLAYQVAGRYFLPWAEKPQREALSIDVAYDRTRLAQDDIAKAVATVRNNLAKSANMVMVDLGIPPGFDLLAEDLQTYQEQSAGRKSGRLEKFSLTATQAILYFDSLAAGDTATIPFRLRAKYPIRAKTFQSRVYEYYDPAVSAIARPVQLEVRRRN
ncbi:MAG TPA: MG2 domain-containing protein [Bryobacteraceae bacterium]